MDGNKVDFNAAYNVAEAIIQEYRDELERIDAKGTGSLINSVDFDIEKNDQEGTIDLKLIVNDYYYFIEFGRNPSYGTGWDDPIGDLTTWLNSKISRGKMVPKGGRPVPSTEDEVKEAAEAIYKKITKCGYYDHYSDPEKSGKHPLRKALENAQADGLIDSFANAFIGAYQEDLVTSIKDLGSRTIPHK